MTGAFIFYDDACGFCCRCAEWLKAQPTFVPVSVLPASQLPVEKGEKAELVVIDSAGGVYRDTDAWLMTLWLLTEWRRWSVRLARGDRSLARKVVELAGSWRHGLSRLFALQSDVDLRRELEVLPESPSCHEGACELPRCRSCGAGTAAGHAFCAKCLAEALRS